MTSLDLGVLAVLAVSGAAGLMRGFIREAFSLGAWVVAFLFAKSLAPLLAPLLTGIEAEALRQLVALVIVFLLILVAASLAGRVLAGMVKWAGLAAYDRLLGLGFGALRGAVIVLIFALAAGLTALPRTPFWQGAFSHGYLESAAKMLIPWLPEGLAAHIRF